MKPLYTKKNGTSQRVAAIEVTMPASYPSANVTYGNGSVEDALDGLTGSSFGTLVDLSSTSASNPYVAPSDGVVLVIYNYSQTGYIYLSVGGVTLYTSKQHSNAAFTWNFPVKKGMSVYMGQTGVTGDPQFVFVPYV